ncbi:5107_t:CDS:1, partial [Acaulospora morrowiae]
KSNEKKTGTSKSLGSPGDKIKRKDTTLSRESKPPRNNSSSSDQNVKVGNKESSNINNKSDDKDIVNFVSPTPLTSSNESVSIPPINKKHVLSTAFIKFSLAEISPSTTEFKQ